MEVTIREAAAADETQLEILRSQAIKATFQRDYDRRTVADLVATVDDDLPDWIESDRHVVLVAETEITPVCYAALDAQDGQLLTVVTSPDYRREGFATEVLARIESRAREHGFETLSATVPTESVPFFDAQDFEQGERTEWHGLAAVQMDKSV